MNVLLLLQLLMVRIATISIFVFILKFQFLHGFFKDLHPGDQVLCRFGQLSKEIKSAVSRTQVSNNLKSMYSFLAIGIQYRFIHIDIHAGSVRIKGDLPQVFGIKPEENPCTPLI